MSGDGAGRPADTAIRLEDVVHTTVTVTADPASPEEIGAAEVTAITEAIKAAAAKRPPVDRQAPWRITGTPYSAARLTVGDLATRLTDMPEHLLVVSGVPQWNRRAAWLVRSTTWDGALVLHTTAPDPDPNALALDLHLPAPANANGTGEAPGPQRSGPRRTALAGALTVGDLAAVLADLPDHAPVMAVVDGWAGTAELVLDRAADYGDCLLLDTGYSNCEASGPADEDDDED
ncbi:hypothetical protein [Kitasatospora sp. NPDC001547]|uniref:hypothetical protein n=1 Tax=Kitasatospora sp. NPDC001547 TaxID=3364015 RepID=UPI0036B76F3E